MSENMSAAASFNAASAILAGGGEMGALMRDYRWSDSPLGHTEKWPLSLRTAIRIMLTSRQPIWIGWGDKLTFFYNDPYKSIIGGKHPRALGLATSEVWKEIWNDIGPMLDTAMGGIEGTYVEGQLLIMERNGYKEETYYTFSYSPIPGDDGQPAGIICANVDDTRRVIGERQLALLRDLAAGITNVRDWHDICAKAAESLATNGRDLPFALIYMAEPGADTLTLVARAGIAEGHAAAPASIPLDANAPWPLARAMREQEIVVLDDLSAITEALPCGAWSQAPRSVALLPIDQAGARRGVVVAGLNPFRLFDEGYRGFLKLIAGQIGAAIANAEAYEQERKRAEALAELDRAKTTFFSNISHEFRTPLTLMLGPVEEMLADGEGLPPVQRERVDIVHRNGLRLLKLVNSLLDFSRIEAGRSQAHFEPTELGSFTADLASNFRSAMDKAGLDFLVSCPALPAPVPVDRDMWEKIVLNLVSNAFKFTMQGAVSVSLAAAADGMVELVVRDTGTGIPAAALPHVFERFRRIEGAHGRSIEGSGIGLALVQELVKLHGGTIGVESVEGEGTAFTVRIPATREGTPADVASAPRPTLRARAYAEEALRWLPGAETAEEAEETEFALRAAVGTERYHVLVADDNADMRDYVCRLVGRHHECETAEDGQAALEAIRRRRPDLVLTDVMMPRLDGFGLIRAIRADPALQDLPVIMLSARAGEEARVEGLSAGADGYLAKPFSARELLARVDGALELARMRQDMARALREETQSLEILNRVGSTVAAELDLDRAVQMVTDAATELTRAAYGAFFYNREDEAGEKYMLYALSGAPRNAFAHMPMPRITPVFAPTFNGTGTVRSDDITQDPRYGLNGPHFGMPAGHLKVRSYLAAPVVSRSGEVLGGILFGHPEPGVFTERDERLVAGIAAQAAIAIDNAHLYRAAQTEIAERRKTEAALRESEERQLRLNQTLEAKVGERTAELEAANEKLREEAVERERIEQVLRQAQKMEAVGKLTGGVAHDFNNLLQVIGGNLQLLNNDVAGNEKAERRLRNALGGVSRASKLASQLLSFGRRQPLAPKVVNLGRFVRGMDDLLRRALGDGIEIETVVSGGLWNTLVDTTQVENALLNLAINARDAMSGHGRLTIEAGNALLDDAYVERHADVVAGQYVMLAVTDTGCGMTPEVLEHVFEPFFTTKPEGQGTGLGLSMVYGFVKQSEGHIKIYSEPGQGTTIRIYLPRVSGSEDVATEVEAGPVLGGTETVLVVEDDDDLRGTVVDMLSDLGYRLLKARDAQSALAIVESGVPIDVLFTDVVMPGPLRSPELARRAKERLPDLAVLFTSGYTDNAIVHGGRLDAGIELLSKPYTREALARKIRHVLRNRQQRMMAAESAGGDAAGGAAPHQDGQGAETPGKLTVLLVEDDFLIRLSTEDMLLELGHTVLEAGHAREALQLLAANAVDVLMTDIGLPGISGRDLALQALDQRPELGLIFASGRDTLPEGEGNERLARAVMLSKPYDPVSLKQALATAMARSVGG